MKLKANLFSISIPLIILFINIYPVSSAISDPASAVSVDSAVSSSEDSLPAFTDTAVSGTVSTAVQDSESHSVSSSDPDAQYTDSSASPYQYDNQPDIIKSILDKEKEITDLKNIIEILQNLDNIYGNLGNNLMNGGKITVFFDPAHGKLASGEWEGTASGRISCTDKPEEYYSILFSRKIYKVLSGNRFIDVKSTDDFMSLLRSESETYNNIPFSKTIELAKKENAFIIISEHLNNIADIRKADGETNLTGIHITRDETGNRYLTYINGTHNGFLTLYNKFDITGFSKKIAERIKKRLVDDGLNPNSWDYGTVADDRFSYFTDFPISVIFESGFISNPAEEARLVDPDYQDTIVKAQYNVLLDTVRIVFGIDLSDDEPAKIKSVDDTLNLLKLSRMAIYYINKEKSEKAISVIQAMEDKFDKKQNEAIKLYSNIKSDLLQAKKLRDDSMKQIRSKNYKRGSSNLVKAVKILAGEPLLQALYNKYNSDLKKYFKFSVKRDSRKTLYAKYVSKPDVKKAARNIPVIFPVENGQDLETAITKALEPSKALLPKLVGNFRNAYVYEKVKITNYSKKKKREIWYWGRKKRKIDFDEGLYIVKLDKNLKVAKTERILQVPLDPNKYQNQQYLKNSYFACQEKIKSL